MADLSGKRPSSLGVDETESAEAIDGGSVFATVEHGGAVSDHHPM